MSDNLRRYCAIRDALRQRGGSLYDWYIKWGQINNTVSAQAGRLPGDQRPRRQADNYIPEGRLCRHALAFPQARLFLPAPPVLD